jgi:hypothetical protein
MMVVVNHVQVFTPVYQPSEDDEKGSESLVISSGKLPMRITLPPIVPHINSMTVVINHGKILPLFFNSPKTMQKVSRVWLFFWHTTHDCPPHSLITWP